MAISSEKRLRSSPLKGSDIESGRAEVEGHDAFDLPPKHLSTEHLRRWKAATLVLNAARRFRYTAEIGEDWRIEQIKSERKERLKRLRTSAQALRAVKRFQAAGAALAEKPCDIFCVDPEKLVEMVQERNLGSLAELGGVQGITSRLRTDGSKGITVDPHDIAKRREVFGPNEYHRQPPKGFLEFVQDAFKDLTLMILILCAILSLGLGIKSHGIKEGWYDGVSIAVAVLLVILVTSVSDYKQSLQFRVLSEEKRNIQVQVIRGGRRMQLSIFHIVVGDIIVLNIGDHVPADGLFVEGHSLLLDESGMTGESEPVHAHHGMPFLLSGSKVVDGQGFMLVTGVGMLTEWGQLMASLGEDTGEETPLQVRLNGAATLIGKVGLTVAILVFVILSIFYFVGRNDVSKKSGKFKPGETSAGNITNAIVEIFTIAVTIVVVAVPEGLPLAVTLTLAYAMKKMIADKALVRRLSACETMGCATVICSDKTGTLTLNRMSVAQAWVAGEVKEPLRAVEGLHKDVSDLLLEGIAQNSNGDVFVPTEGGELEVNGSPTEKAVLQWGLNIGMDFRKVRLESAILQVETFNSIKKRSGVVVRSAKGGEVHIHWKGAAEIIVEECEALLSADGSTIPITLDGKSELLTMIEGMAAESLRCLAFAFRRLDFSEVPDEDKLEQWKIPEGPLTLISIVGFKDPCRSEVPFAVRQCQTAGIKVMMITGDNLVTAKSIATECGILECGLAVEGSTFRNWSPEEREETLDKIEVMARSSPSDKLLMVRLLRERGEVVAVTGDGTNDAPALREADIGLAMGIQGTEVAKENADIIIMDDNFVSVVRVVQWGRSVYLNIQKFIQFQLTVNVAALSVNFVAAVSFGSVPLTAVQLLWVNLIMDTLGALALATEGPSSKLLLKPPVGRKEPLISNIMWRNIFSQAAFQAIVLLILQFRGEGLLGLLGKHNADAVNRTIIFNTFVLCQLFNEVNARKLEELNVFRGILSNWLFLAIVGGSLLLQVIFVEILNRFASTVRLEWKYWGLCTLIGWLSWPLSFFIKFIPVPHKPLASANLKPLRRPQARKKCPKMEDGAKSREDNQMRRGSIDEA